MCIFALLADTADSSGIVLKNTNNISAVMPLSESKFYEVVAALDVLCRDPQTWCEDCVELNYLESLKELTAD